MAVDPARVKALFLEASDLPSPAERAAYLDRECGGEPELRARVEALLGADDGAGRLSGPDVTGMAETTAPESEGACRASVPEKLPPGTVPAGRRPDGDAPTSAGTPPADRPGESAAGRVIAGRYTLLDVLGEGGMGTVYRAEQTRPVKRVVALKLIKVGMDSRAVLARFDAERQALALMDHPNIARVYDGGTTAAGQPFFVMELVEGEPITAYCDRHRLSVRARLELFVSACHAVQHAHQKGIIHRDLKPSNILVAEVDGRPTPKVIDFGVAKATEQRLTDLSLVETGAIVGTPAYMSPEQADPSSRDIDTRTDVYALGVILYELLAGSPPVDAEQFRRGALLEMLRMVREIDPPRPSTRVSTSDALPSIAASRGIEPSQLKQLLRGDLDWIVMKALEKDRARRYETANGFGADVLRHLAHEPVLAAPPSRAYRVRKFVRKHRGAVVAVSLIVLALLAGITGTTWGLFRAERARDAEAERVQERDAALGKARDAERSAADRADKLKYQLGVSDFLLASAAYDNRDVALAAERLGNVPPDQRGWEWHYLQRLTRGGLFSLYGHTGAVRGAAFSPDGARIVTASSDRTAKVWDARTGTPLLELKGHTGGVASAALSPDGYRIVTASDDRTAKVWDARSGTQLLELKGHTGGVASAAFSPDGYRIVTASSDRTAKVWDARSGSALLELKGHTGPVDRAGFSPDGARIVTVSMDGPAKVWDARSGTQLLELKGHTGNWVNSAAFSPDGARIVTASSDRTAKVWDARTGTPLLELKGHTGWVSNAWFSPDGARIVTASGDRTAKVWDARSGSALLDLKGHTGTVVTAAFSPDGARIVTASDDRTAKVWDARTGTPLLELKGRTNNSLTSAAFSPDGARIVTASSDRTAKVWDARTGTPLLDLKGHKSWLTSAAFSPDGARIVTASGDRTAKVWDARSGSALLDLKGHTGTVVSAAFSPDGARIVTASDDRTAKVWDARTGTQLLDLKGHTGGVASAAFSPDGYRIVTASDDGTAKVWDAWSGTQLLELKGRTNNSLTSPAFSPDGARIVTASDDRTAKVWDARTGTPLLDLKGHAGTVMSAAFSPDGARIVTASDDRTAKVWDARTGTPLLELKGRTNNSLTSPAFSPDGTRIVTASDDRTAKVWDARSGTPLLELTGHTYEVTSAWFSPDGARIVTASVDQTAKVWDARTGSALLDLKGHAGAVVSAAFSPDGARIVTASGIGPVKMWDARTGTPLLDLKGHTGWVSSAWFSPDGARIVTASSDRTAKVWDARSGEELKGEPIPPAPRSGPISPDGRLIAHPAGNRVELIPLQPDEEELSYRRLLMRPDSHLYREAYDAAVESKDDFTARFYLNLFPPAERTRIRAETIVKPLFARLLLRQDVLAALQARPAADPEIHAACLNLAGTWPESASDWNEAGWRLVRDPGQPDATYRRGLRLAKDACGLEPDDGRFLTTLGVAQYRCGLVAEAIATLTRSNGLNGGNERADLAFLALAQHRLGQAEKARATLGRLREVISHSIATRDSENQAFLREAEAIDPDAAFPADPFAP